MSFVASYCYVFGGKVARTIEVGDDFHVDLDTEGRVVGVETLGHGDWTQALVKLAMEGRVVAR